MQKSEFVGVRLGPEEIKTIEERAKESSVDKSTALRQLLKMGIRQFNLERGIELYAHGKVSIGKAAEIAQVSIWEMMDLLMERKIPAGPDKEDFRKGMENLMKISPAKK